MMRLAYRGEFLDLGTGTQAEFERVNPLFSNEIELQEVSTAVTLQWTERNVRLIGPIWYPQAIRNTLKLDVDVYDRETFRYQGTLVIDGAITHAWFAGKQSLRGNVLIGASKFKAVLEEKLLSQLSLGGDRTFQFTSWDPADGSAGVWQHIHETRNGQFDYAFFTIRNDGLYGDVEGAPEWMNLQDAAGYVDSGLMFPAIRRKYILTQIFAEHGWTADFSALQDTSWEKLFMQSFKPVVTQNITGFGQNTGQPIVWRLAEHMPEEVTCVQFINSMQRFGIKPIFDVHRQVCRFVALDEQRGQLVKDWTPYAQPAADAQLGEGGKVVSFTVNYTGNDSAVDDKDLKGFNTGQKFQNRAALPAPTMAADNDRLYTVEENIYWGVTLDETTNQRIWFPDKDGIFGEEHKKDTHRFEFMATPFPLRWCELPDPVNNQNLQMLLPVATQKIGSEFGIRELFYHGFRAVMDMATNSHNAYNIVYGSPLLNCPGSLATASAWSNILRHPQMNNDDKGLIKAKFDRWNARTALSEEITRNISLPLHELANLNWETEYIIDHVSYMVKSYLENVAYQGFIQCKLQRMIAGATLSVTTNPGGGNTAVTIFLRFEIEVVPGVSPLVDGPDMIGLTTTYNNLIYANTFIRAYGDLAATNAISVNNLQVTIVGRTMMGGVDMFPPTTQTRPMSGHEVCLTDYQGPNGTVRFPAWWEYDKTVVDAAGNPYGTHNGHWTSEVKILPNGTAYQIIP